MSFRYFFNRIHEKPSIIHSNLGLGIDQTPRICEKQPMRFSINALVILTFLSPAYSYAAIFGADDRVPVYQDLRAQKISRSVAISILSSLREDVNDQFIKIAAEPALANLCEGEKFRKDLSMQWSCTGFLVAPDILMTAGHCMVNTGEIRNESKGYCEIYSWLFDYVDTANTSADTNLVSKERLYSCKKILYAVMEESAPFRDFALVQLDRPVVGRSPLTLSKTPVGSGMQNLSVIGFPFGTSAKLAKNGKVLKNNLDRQSFLTSLDVFGGNSGSPVLDSKMEVIGILVGGTPVDPFYQDSKRSCEKYNRCDDRGLNCILPDLENRTSQIAGYQGVGSEVQRIEPVISELKKIQE